MRIRSTPALSSRQQRDALSTGAFTALVDRHQHPLYVFLRGLIGSSEQARDLTQDTFADAWRCAQAVTLPFTAAHADDEVRRWLFHAAYQNSRLSAPAFRHGGESRVARRPRSTDS